MLNDVWHILLFFWKEISRAQVKKKKKKGHCMAQYGFKVMGVLCGAQFAQMKDKNEIVILTSQRMMLDAD